MEYAAYRNISHFFSHHGPQSDREVKIHQLTLNVESHANCHKHIQVIFYHKIKKHDIMNKECETYFIRLFFLIAVP